MDTPTAIDGGSAETPSPAPSFHPLRTILVWGPWLVALLSLLGVIGVGWVSTARIARLEGALESRNAMEMALRTEILTWQSHVMVLQRLMEQRGIPTPNPPSPLSIPGAGQPQSSPKKR